jgi:hypothetical protein
MCKFLIFPNSAVKTQVDRSGLEPPATVENFCWPELKEELGHF